MVVRIPERRYIETLIAGRISSPLLVDDLQARKVQIPGAKDLTVIYEELVKTNPEYFSSPDSEADPEWLKDLGLSPMFYFRWKKPTDVSLKGCEGAFKLLEDQRVMRYIHVLSFSGVADDDVELILNARYNISYETEAFQTVLRYFADYKDWAVTDKEIYADQILDQDLKKQYKTGLKEDQGQLLWEIGLGVDPDMSIEEAMKDMFNDSYRFFKRFQKNRPEDARDYAALAVKIADRVAGLKDKESTSQDLISQLKITLTNQESKPDPKQTIINFTDLHIELPPPTSESIPNLDAMMLQDGPVKVEDNNDD